MKDRTFNRVVGLGLVSVVVIALCVAQTNAAEEDKEGAYGAASVDNGYQTQGGYKTQYAGPGYGYYTIPKKTFPKADKIFNPHAYMEIYEQYSLCREHKCPKPSTDYHREVSETLAELGTYTSCVMGCAGAIFIDSVIAYRDILSQIYDKYVASLTQTRILLSGGQSDIFDPIEDNVHIEDSCCLPSDYFVPWENVLITVPLLMAEMDANSTSGFNKRYITASQLLEDCHRDTMSGTQDERDLLDTIRYTAMCNRDQKYPTWNGYTAYLDIISKGVGQSILAPKCEELAPNGGCCNSLTSNPRAIQFPQQTICLAVTYSNTKNLGGQPLGPRIIGKDAIPHLFGEIWEHDGCPPDKVYCCGDQDSESISDDDDYYSPIGDTPVQWQGDSASDLDRDVCYVIEYEEYLTEDVSLYTVEGLPSFVLNEESVLSLATLQWKTAVAQGNVEDQGENEDRGIDFQRTQILSYLQNLDDDEFGFEGFTQSFETYAESASDLDSASVYNKWCAFDYDTHTPWGLNTWKGYTGYEEIEDLMCLPENAVHLSYRVTNAAKKHVPNPFFVSDTYPGETPTDEYLFGYNDFENNEFIPDVPRDHIDMTCATEIEFGLALGAFENLDNTNIIFMDSEYEQEFALYGVFGPESRFQVRVTVSLSFDNILRFKVKIGRGKYSNLRCIEFSRAATAPCNMPKDGARDARPTPTTQADGRVLQTQPEGSYPVTEGRDVEDWKPIDYEIGFETINLSRTYCSEKNSLDSFTVHYAKLLKDDGKVDLEDDDTPKYYVKHVTFEQRGRHNRHHDTQDITCIEEHDDEGKDSAEEDVFGLASVKCIHPVKPSKFTVSWPNPKLVLGGLESYENESNAGAVLTGPELFEAILEIRYYSNVQPLYFGDDVITKKLNRNNDPTANVKSAIYSDCYYDNHDTLQPSNQLILKIPPYNKDIGEERLHAKCIPFMGCYNSNDDLCVFMVQDLRVFSHHSEKPDAFKSCDAMYQYVRAQKDTAYADTVSQTIKEKWLEDSLYPSQIGIQDWTKTLETRPFHVTNGDFYRIVNGELISINTFTGEETSYTAYLKGKDGELACLGPYYGRKEVEDIPKTADVMVEAAKNCPKGDLFEYCNMPQYASYLQEQLYDTSSCEIPLLAEMTTESPELYGSLACMYRVTTLKVDCMEAVLNCYESEYHLTSVFAQTIGKAASILCGILLCQRPNVYSLFGGISGQNLAGGPPVAPAATQTIRSVLLQAGFATPTSAASLPPATIALVAFGIGMAVFVLINSIIFVTKKKNKGLESSSSGRTVAVEDGYRNLI